MVRFIYRRDFESVLQNAFRLKGNPLNINQQFPGEIEARRMKLYPVMKQVKREGKYVSLVRDKLFVDGEQFMMMENKN